MSGGETSQSERPVRYATSRSSSRQGSAPKRKVAQSTLKTPPRTGSATRTRPQADLQTENDVLKYRLNESERLRKLSEDQAKHMADRMSSMSDQLGEINQLEYRLKESERVRQLHEAQVSHVSKLAGTARAKYDDMHAAAEHYASEAQSFHNDAVIKAQQMADMSKYASEVFQMRAHQEQHHHEMQELQQQLSLSNQRQHVLADQA